VSHGENDKKFLLKYKLLGGHVHVQVFECPKHGSTWEKNGELVFGESSWVQFMYTFLTSKCWTVKETMGEDGWTRVVLE
jgi:hypothetical protein